MKIALTSPFEERVPPVKYGGTELVVYNITEELIQLGHDVKLIASGDSQTSAKLIPIFQRSLRSNPKFNDLKLRDSFKFMGIGKVCEYLSKNKFDIIHNHIGWRLLPFQKLLPAPVVTTLHGPLDVPYQQEVYGEYKNSYFISISHNQRKPMPDLNFIANVYNGIDVDKFNYSEETEDYFVFLGRMSPEKGPVQAIKIAKMTGKKLIMAAKVDSVDEEFYKKEVEPLIDNEQIRFIGEIDHEEKNNLLGKAKCLLAPIQWEEPFGLYFVEAMACGTPVITMRRGSAPEIIKDKETGFICDSIEEAAERTKLIDSISRKKCRQHVEAEFSRQVMTERYLDAYQKAIQLHKDSMPVYM